MTAKTRLYKILKNLVINTFSFVIIFVLVSSIIGLLRAPKLDRLPSIHTHGLTGKSILLDKASAQPTLIYVWGSWCGVCKTTSPMVSKLSSGSKVNVVSIAVQSGSNQDILDYLSRHGWQSLADITINDDTGSIMQALGGRATPTFFLVTRSKQHNQHNIQGLTGYHSAIEITLRFWLMRMLD